MLINNDHIERGIIGFIDEEDESVYFYIDIEYQYNDKENRHILHFSLKDKDGEIETIIVKLNNDEIDNIEKFEKVIESVINDFKNGYVLGGYYLFSNHSWVEITEEEFQVLKKYKYQ
jgi:hypothetical protein